MRITPVGVFEKRNVFRIIWRTQKKTKKEIVFRLM